ncbi:MAG: hypothetical protein JNM80_07760 [Phycisphaerae bacterium]|nr:hypothetical protein [Phycisphaerae bacterium]
MPILPDGRVERVEFVEAHVPIWTTNATAIGLTSLQVSALSASAATARTAFNGAEAARAASKAATANFYNKVREMTDLAADAIKAIKLKAAQTNDPGVYVLAQIPAPLPPGPPPPLEAPADVVADPNADGTITIKWKGSSDFQTFFSVWRRVSGAGGGGWMNLGSTAIKKFIDSTVPSPVPSSVVYQVRAQRGNEVGPPSTFAEVQFGGPGGSFFEGGVAGFVGGSADPGTTHEAA